MKEVTIKMDLRDLSDVVMYLQSVQTMNRESINIYDKLGFAIPSMLSKEIVKLDRIIETLLSAANKK